MGGATKHTVGGLATALCGPHDRCEFSVCSPLGRAGATLLIHSGAVALRQRLTSAQARELAGLLRHAAARADSNERAVAGLRRIAAGKSYDGPLSDLLSFGRHMAESNDPDVELAAMTLHHKAMLQMEGGGAWWVEADDAEAAKTVLAALNPRPPRTGGSGS